MRSNEKPFGQLPARKQDEILVGKNGLWCKVVKLRAGNRCEWGFGENRCTKTTGLESHHIKGRKNYDVRYDLDNGACLCFSHHKGTRDSAHENSELFMEMMLEKRGQAWHTRLREKSMQYNIKVDKVKAYEILNEELKRLEG